MRSLWPPGIYIVHIHVDRRTTLVQVLMKMGGIQVGCV